MKKLLFVLILLFYLEGNGLSYALNPKIVVLSDVVQRFVNNPKILALVCWDEETLLGFIKLFNGLDLKIGIRQIDLNSLPYDNENFDTILIDWTCSDTKEFLMSLELSKYEQFKWILINVDFLENQNLIHGINLHYVGVGSDFTLILKENEENNKFIIQKVYKIHRFAPMSIEFHGKWWNSTYTGSENHPIISRRRQNLRGSTIRASMVITHNDSLNHLDDYRDQHIDTIAKVNFILTNHLISFMNATVRYSIVDTWGYLNKDDGKWNGMIGELTENKADIGATALFFTENRISVIQYVSMTTKTLSKIVFQSPKLSYTDNVFLLPFSKIVWICVILTVPIIASVLLIVMLAEWKVPLKPHRQTEKVRKTLFERKIINKDGTQNFLPLDKGVALLRKGLYGFHFETGPGYKLISETFNEDEKCGLQEISFLQMIDPYYAIQKNSTLKEIIKIGLYEHGIQNRENIRYYTRKPQCSGTGGKFISVSIIDVQPAILLLLWGFGLASVCFLSEITIKRTTKSKQLKCLIKSKSGK
uniref:CSON011044 protein n=1 Tax=Culicoides sonorensis TaxID=179676 RepID=A0A336M5H9_CULSO